MARRKKPYTVIPLKFSDFLNFKPITQLFLPSNPVDTNWMKVQWLKIKWFQYRKRDMTSIYFRYDYDEEEFHQIKLKQPSKCRGSFAINENIPYCYT
jgi:hypothetical protein